MPVIFKNLLEEQADDICCGIIQENGYIACSCGCNGIFEPEDAEILDYYGDADFPDVQVYSMRDFISEVLPTLADEQVVNFSSSGDTGCNFGIGFQYIFETKVLVAGYWGGYSMEDETGDVRLFNCAQRDLRGDSSWPKDKIARQLTAMIKEIDGRHLGFLFVKPFDVLRTTVTEACPNCGAENSISDWSLEKDGLTAYCPRCGNLMMLCSECDDRCSWSPEKNRCDKFEKEESNVGDGRGNS